LQYDTVQKLADALEATKRTQATDADTITTLSGQISVLRVSSTATIAQLTDKMGDLETAL